MAKGLSFGTAFAGAHVSPSAQAVEIPPESPFRILVLANLRGDHAEQEQANRTWRPMIVDRDNFEEVMAKVRPTLMLADVSADGATIELEFPELDAFHPDQLISAIGEGPVCGQQSSAVPSSTVPDGGPANTTSKQKAAAPTTALSGDDLLDQMLQQTPSAAADPESRTQGEFQNVLDNIAAKHRVAPENQALRQQQESAVSARLRAVLHHPRFRTLEATWRSLDFLVRRLETSAQLQIGIVDCSKTKLADELTTANDLKTTGLYKLLCDQPSGTPAWTLVIGDFAFGANIADLETLGRISLIAAQAAAPFVAAAGPAIFGCTSLAEAADEESWQSPDPEQAAAWQMLRQFPTASWLGLACPRFLLRLPYGPDTSPIEHQEFDEMPTPRHADYVWGNSSYLVAHVLATTFAESGWQMQGSLQRDIQELPMHAYAGDDDSVAQPCLEAALVDRHVATVVDAGIIPLQAFRDGMSARMVRLCSIADPPAALSGRWQ